MPTPTTLATVVPARASLARGRPRPRGARTAPAALLVTGALALVLSVPPAAGFEGLQPGMRAPAVSLEGLDGKRVALPSGPPARATLVVFWATWSGKSQEVLERVERLQRRHRGQGLVVLGINVESPRPSTEELARVRRMVERSGLSFPVVIDRGLAVFHAYGVVAVPSSVLVGADGTVLGALAAYPIAGREEFFDLLEATVTGRELTRRAAPAGPRVDPRAVRYFNLGRTLAARGLGDEAAKNLGKAVELDPDFPLPRILLGQLKRERAQVRETVQGRGGAVATVRMSEQEREALLGEAEGLVKEALRVAPDSPAALTELAMVREARGDRQRARELLEHALRVNADFPPARSHLGALLLAVGDEARGRAELAAAVALNPVDWRLHITAGEAYEARGLAPEAVEAYRKGVELLWQERLGHDDGGVRNGGGG